MWIVVAYYTPDYKKHADRLIASVNKLRVPCDINLVNELGDWYKNTQFKPMFLKQMLDKHNPKSIIYVDADAEFIRYPVLFDELDNHSSINIAVHILDHSKYRRSEHPPELLSGTIYLKNNSETHIIIDEWIKECSTDPKLWDQRALDRVLKHHIFNFNRLPEEYCVIYDYMSNVKHPVIKHYQASREFRGKKK